MELLNLATPAPMAKQQGAPLTDGPSVLQRVRQSSQHLPTHRIPKSGSLWGKYGKGMITKETTKFEEETQFPNRTNEPFVEWLCCANAVSSASCSSDWRNTSGNHWRTGKPLAPSGWLVVCSPCLGFTIEISHRDTNMTMTILLTIPGMATMQLPMFPTSATKICIFLVTGCCSGVSRAA